MGDAEVGDGTTSVVILAGEFLKQCKPFVEEGVHPRIIIRSFRKATALALAKINEISIKIDKNNATEYRALLEKCAATSMSSKLIHQQKDYFSKLVVDAVMMLDEQTLPLNMIGIKKVTGGALEDTELVPGVAFEKTFSYAGFEMQKKNYTNPKIALLNIELELKAEKDNAEVRLENVAEYQKVVDAEWNILYDKLDRITASGAKVVLSKLPIGDVATQYFADRDMFCAGRVPEEDMELSKYLRNYSRTIAGKEQLIIGAMAKAFEVIARQLCDNAGFDATNILNKLRQKHAGDGIWYGVDIMNEDIADNYAA